MFNRKMSGAEFRALREALGLSQSFMADRILNKDGKSLQLRTLSHWEQSRIIMPDDCVSVLLRYKQLLDDLTGFLVDLAEDIAAQTGPIAFLTAFSDKGELSEWGLDLGELQGMGVTAYNICLANAVDDLASLDSYDAADYEQRLESLEPDQTPADLPPRIPAWVTMFHADNYRQFLDSTGMDHTYVSLALWGASTAQAEFDREMGAEKDKLLK